MGAFGDRGAAGACDFCRRRLQRARCSAPCSNLHTSPLHTAPRSRSRLIQTSPSTTTTYPRHSPSRSKMSLYDARHPAPGADGDIPEYVLEITVLLRVFAVLLPRTHSFSVHRENRFKLLIVGDSGVGKSAVFNRFTDHTYTESHIATIGVDFKIRTCEFDGVKVRLQIWDTAGQERFHSIVTSFYRGAHGVVVVYDVTNRDSFNHVKLWLDEVRSHGSAPASLLIGNKSDLVHRRQVETAAGQAFAAEHNMLFHETSAKNSAGVDAAFESLVRKLVTVPRTDLHKPRPTITAPLPTDSSKANWWWPCSLL